MKTLNASETTTILNEKENLEEPRSRFICDKNLIKKKYISFSRNLNFTGWTKTYEPNVFPHAPFQTNVGSEEVIKKVLTSPGPVGNGAEPMERVTAAVSSYDDERTQIPQRNDKKCE